MKTTEKISYQTADLTKIAAINGSFACEKSKGVCIFHGVCKMGERKSFKISHITHNNFYKILSYAGSRHHLLNTCTFEAAQLTHSFSTLH